MTATSQAMMAAADGDPTPFEKTANKITNIVGSWFFVGAFVVAHAAYIYYATQPEHHNLDPNLFKLNVAVTAETFAVTSFVLTSEMQQRKREDVLIKTLKTQIKEHDAISEEEHQQLRELEKTVEEMEANIDRLARGEKPLPASEIPASVPAPAPDEEAEDKKSWAERITGFFASPKFLVPNFAFYAGWFALAQLIPGFDPGLYKFNLTISLQTAAMASIVLASNLQQKKQHDKIIAGLYDAVSEHEEKSKEDRARIDALNRRMRELNQRLGQVCLPV